MRRFHRDWLHSLFIAAGMGVAIVGGLLFRGTEGLLMKAVGALLTTAGGMGIFVAYRITPLDDPGPPARREDDAGSRGGLP